jgi:hypothetical protein
MLLESSMLLPMLLQNGSFCVNSFGTIPISSILASVLKGLDDEGGSLALDF